MLKEQKNNIFVLGIVAILAISLATPIPAAALDIETILMSSDMEYDNGTLDTDPWGFSIWIKFVDTGSLDHIDITLPGALTPFTSIYEDYYLGWNYESWPTSYPTLAGLQTDYPTGTYTLEFENISDTVLRTVTLDYSSLPGEPCEPVDFTYPSINGQPDIETYPTLTWNIDPGAGGALAMWLGDDITDEDIYWDVPAPMDTTSWTPGSLLTDRSYILSVSVINVKNLDLEDGPALPTMTVGIDTFECCLMIDYMNEIEFTTVPEPATIVLLGLGGLLLRRRKNNQLSADQKKQPRQLFVLPQCK